MALADMHAELEAARRLALHAAWLADAGAETASRESAAARLVAAETAGVWSIAPCSFTGPSAS